MKAQKTILYFGAVIVSIAMITAASSVIATSEQKPMLDSDISTYITPNIKPLSDPGDILFTYDVETPTGDIRCLGVEYDGQYIWVTGGNDQVTPKLHKYEADGTYITSYDQGTTTAWGWRDLAWDGTYLYASDENELAKIDPTTGLVVELMTKPAGFETVPCRGLAYDPATDHFYTANWASQIVEFDRDGNIINSYSNSFSVYGLAWDDVTEGGPWLWVHSQDMLGDDIETLVSQVDPTTGIPTGVQFVGWNDPAAANNLAGGACFVEDWEGEPIFIGLTQSSPDTVFGMDISIPMQPDLEITEIAGGFGCTVTIKNVGNADATNIDWSITLDGGLVILGKETTGTISTLAPEDSISVKSSLLFGFGKPTITVAAESAEGAIADDSAAGTLLLFFLLGL